MNLPFADKEYFIQFNKKNKSFAFIFISSVFFNFCLKIFVH